MALTGFGFVVGGETEDGTYELYSIPTTWIRPDHSDGPYSKFYIVNPANPSTWTSTEPLTSDQVAFAYFPNPSDPMAALAPARAVSRAVTIDDHIQNSQSMFFENGVFPSVVVTVGSNPHPDVPAGVRPRLTANQRRQVYAAIRKVSGGVSNYGTPAIVDGLIEKIERLSATQNEMGWEKSEQTVKQRIMSAFGVHPFILGENIPGSYAQAYIVQELFYKKVNTYLNLLSTMLTDFLNPFVDDNIEIWYDECVAKDPSMEKAMWEGARNRDDVTQNEFRAFMGLPPDEDRKEAVINKSSIQTVAALAAQVGAGSLKPEQGVAILEGMGLETELAKKIIGKGPPKQLPGQSPQGAPSEQAPPNEGLEQAFKVYEEALKELRMSPEEHSIRLLESV